MLCSRCQRRGLSLPELLGTLILIGLILGLGMLPLARSRQRAGTQALASVLASELRTARQLAVTRGYPVAVAFPSQGGTRHSQSLYYLEGVDRPRITRVVDFEQENPGACIFSGHWPVAAGLSNQRGNTGPPVNGQGFSIGSWNRPEPQDPTLIFLPSGGVVADGISFDGAFHLVACRGPRYVPATVSGSPSLQLTACDDPWTVSISFLGEVETRAGVAGEAPGAVSRSSGPGDSVARLVRVPGANQPPVIEGTPQAFPIPNPDTLPGGVDATVDLQGYLTLRVEATDPDGDQLYCSWTTADGGGFSESAEVPMGWDSRLGRWVGIWEWRPPEGAADGSQYALGCTVRDSQGQTVTALLGAQGVIKAFSFEKIVYCSVRDNGNREIFIMNADGTDARNLTNDPAADTYPVLSPDGSKILFVSDRLVPPEREIYVMNVDGTGLRRLTGPGSATNANDVNYPSWTLDGTRIAYSGLLGASNWQLRTRNPDGTDPGNPNVMDSQGIFGQNTWLGPTQFHPTNPNRLISMQLDPAGPGCGIVELDTSGNWTTRLSNSTANDYDGHFSPDGTKVCFHSDRSGQDEVWVGDYTPGSVLSNLKQITSTGGSFPYWAPDNRHLVLISNWEVCKVDTQDPSLTLVPLTQDNRVDEYPCWSR